MTLFGAMSSRCATAFPAECAYHTECACHACYVRQHPRLCDYAAKFNLKAISAETPSFEVDVLSLGIGLTSEDLKPGLIARFKKAILMYTRTLQNTCLSLALSTLAAAVSAAPFVSPHGYSFLPPSGWQVDRSHSSGEDISLFAVHGNTALPLAPAFSVKLAPVAGAVKLNDLKQPLADEYRKSFPQITILSETYSTVGGLRALNIVFTHPKDGSLIHDRQTIVVRNHFLYFFTAVCPDKVHAKYDPIFTRLLASVHWKA